MPLNLPEGKTLSVNIGVDFDAQGLWMGVFNQTSPSSLSRGEYCAEVAAPRLAKGVIVVAAVGIDAIVRAKRG